MVKKRPKSRKGAQRKKKKISAKRVQHVSHEESTKVLSGALLDSKKRRAARNHPVVGPLMKKLGPSGVKTLAAMAKNAKDQGYCTCPPHA